MDCVNHPGVAATAYCQNCGKALCGACVRTAPGGQILCEPCWAAWHSVQPPVAGMYTGTPNPAVAAALGVIPGVGAMYNGQFLKGFVHVFIFAVLVSTAGHYPIFGLFIAAWIIYQAFEAYHVAKARRDGQPAPDPLGLNEISNWLNIGGRQQMPPPPPPGAPGNPGPETTFSSTGAGYQSTGQGPQQTPPWGAPYQGSAQGPGPGQGPYPPFGGPGGLGGPGGIGGPGGPFGPGFPPVPPFGWKRKEPIGAVILIGLGLLFLLNKLDLFSGHVFEFLWPLLLIGIGLWMVVRHVQESQGGPK